MDQHPDVIRNAQAVDWLKAELVSAVAAVLHASRSGREESLCEALAGLLLLAYLLGQRLGVAPVRVDSRLAARLQAHLAAGHELEAWFGDLSALAAYLDGRRGARA